VQSWLLLQQLTIIIFLPITSLLSPLKSKLLVSLTFDVVTLVVTLGHLESRHSAVFRPICQVGVAPCDVAGRMPQNYPERFHVFGELLKEHGRKGMPQCVEGAIFDVSTLQGRGESELAGYQHVFPALPC
jgi:hypothetical protein